MLSYLVNILKCIPNMFWRQNNQVLKSELGEGNGTLLQYSCLENPRDGGAWWAAICGVTQSRTRLKQLSSSSSSKETFHAKMGTITDRNDVDLTEAEAIKKRCKNTQNCTKKIFRTKIITMV